MIRFIIQLIRMLEKDIKLFWRDRRTLSLIILTPIIIMAALGIIFSGKTAADSISGVSLGVCNKDTQPLSLDIPIFSIIPLNQKGKVPCDVLARQRVERGELRGAIVIPSNFSSTIQQGYGSTITLYVDTAKSQTAVVVIDAMKAIVQDMNENIGVAFIGEAWKNLNQLNANLKTAVAHLAAAKTSAERIRQRTIALRASLDRFDSSLTDAYTVNMTEHLSSAHSILQETRQLIQAANETQSSSVLLGQVHNATAILLAAQPNASLEVITFNDSITGLIVQYDAARQSRIQNTLAHLTALQSEVEQAQDRQAMLTEQLSAMESKRQELLSTIDQMDEAVLNATNDLIALIDQLNQTTALLDVYTAREPINIVRAVSLDEQSIYGEKSYFEFLAPGLMALVLLFITLFISSAAIVTERRSGTMARSFLTPMPTSLFLAGKVMYLFILCMIQIIIMMVIIRLFGVSFPITPAFFFMAACMSFAFITLGLLIGSIAKTENTALLASLVLSIPMLFLSGMFFPFEIMPKIMQSIGSQLPLTLSILNLERLTIYMTGIETSMLAKMLIEGLVFFILAYVFVKLRPTPD